MIGPIMCNWDGEVFKPIPRHHNAVNAHFVVGQHYVMEELQERSSATHRHYFASVKEAWMNLPEGMGDSFPTPEHLRKYALIKAGFRDERTIVAASRAEALRLATFIRPMDEFAIVSADGATVTVWTAKSQSMRAMGKQEFAASKEAVLDILANMIEVKPGDLSRAAA